MSTPSKPIPPLLAYPFRPFFLLVGLYGALLILAWMGLLFGLLSLPIGVNPAQWHAHEMLFGLVPAAIAGFLLTAMCNWTGAPPLAGRGLLALILLWVAGRAAMWLAGLLPAGLVFLVDALFLPILAIYAGHILRRYNNRRNLILVAVLGLLTLANIAMHAGWMGNFFRLTRTAEIATLDLIAALMIVIGGRITPAFTANWLKRQGQDPERVRSSMFRDSLAIGSAFAMIPADLIPGAGWLVSLTALVACLANGARLFGWAGWRARREPLLWILHLGYAWIVLALLIKGLSPWVGWPESAWFHAMGSGAIATLILGVMTRVALGHTGRPLVLPRFAVLIYLFILAAGIARLLAALNLVPYSGTLWLAAAGWFLAFLLFVLLYAPILASPRADGRPG